MMNLFCCFLWVCRWREREDTPSSAIFWLVGCRDREGVTSLLLTVFQHPTFSLSIFLSLFYKLKESLLRTLTMESVLFLISTEIIPEFLVFLPSKHQYFGFILSACTTAALAAGFPSYKSLSRRRQPHYLIERVFLLSQRTKLIHKGHFTSKFGCARKLGNTHRALRCVTWLFQVFPAAFFSHTLYHKHLIWVWWVLFTTIRPWNVDDRQTRSLRSQVTTMPITP
jgi:hypothetical protein